METCVCVGRGGGTAFLCFLFSFWSLAPFLAPPFRDAVGVTGDCDQCEQTCREAVTYMYCILVTGGVGKPRNQGGGRERPGGAGFFGKLPTG